MPYEFQSTHTPVTGGYARIRDAGYRICSGRQSGIIGYIYLPSPYSSYLGRSDPKPRRRWYQWHIWRKSNTQQHPKSCWSDSERRMNHCLQRCFWRWRSVVHHFLNEWSKLVGTGNRHTLIKARKLTKCESRAELRLRRRYVDSIEVRRNASMSDHAPSFSTSLSRKNTIGKDCYCRSVAYPPQSNQATYVD